MTRRGRRAGGDQEHGHGGRGCEEAGPARRNHGGYKLALQPPVQPGQQQAEQEQRRAQGAGGQRPDDQAEAGRQGRVAAGRGGDLQADRPGGVGTGQLVGGGQHEQGEDRGGGQAGHDQAGHGDGGRAGHGEQDGPRHQAGHSPGQHAPVAEPLGHRAEDGAAGEHRGPVGRHGNGGRGAGQAAAGGEVDVAPEPGAGLDPALDGGERHRHRDTRRGRDVFRISRNWKGSYGGPGSYGGRLVPGPGGQGEQDGHRRREGGLYGVGAAPAQPGRQQAGGQERPGGGPEPGGGGHPVDPPGAEAGGGVRVEGRVDRPGPQPEDHHADREHPHRRGGGLTGQGHGGR